MSLPFALRSRISLDEPVRRAPRVRVPKVVGPIFAYWSVMGMLAYGVSTGALPLDEWFWPKKPPKAFTAPPVDEAPWPPPPARTSPREAPPVDLGAPLAAAPMDPSLPVQPVPPMDLEDEHPPAFLQEPGASRPAALADDAPAVARSEPPREEIVQPTNTVATSIYGARDDVPDAPPRRAEEKRAAVALREPPAPHGEWTQPSFFGPAATETSGRVVLHAPSDASRGARHVDDGAWLFTEDETPRTPAKTTNTPAVAATHTLPEARALPEEAASPVRPAANVGSCEAAIASANDVIDMTKGRGAPDVSANAYSSILTNGRYVTACRVPATMKVDICAAVRDGRTVGVTVTTSPRSSEFAACVKRAVTRLSFPSSPRLDVTRTHFDAAR